MSDLAAIRRRWSTAYDRGAHDYTDAGCRVLAEHAFRDVPLLLDIAEAAQAFHTAYYRDRQTDEDDAMEVLAAALARLPASGSSGGDANDE